MSVLAYLILAAVGALACGFALWPIWARGAGRGRLVLGGAALLFMLGIGGGLYVYFGHPFLAERTLQGANARDLNALIGRLATAVRGHPEDPRGWALLGQAYATAHDPQDASRAFGRAIETAQGRGLDLSPLYSAYGETLTQASAGAVTPDAEAAFTQALATNPRDQASRYYLGLAAAARGNAPQALAYWNSLLADVPANSPVHADLVDRIAGLTARSGGGAPNIADMVAGLAARLKANPDDPVGWQRLIRAYAVLGDKDKARAALGDARKAARADQISALDAEAKELGL
ncbi:MAG TPA: tetratricopeptide repeat protein [Rhizomicrobium sp.]|jgi:cytochrome c-type biogenesis protein CcmH|nr:tetratricopeptide repeat protein [Rhizomicrobium sp.]